jgi:hypothetical protein
MWKRLRQHPFWSRVTWWAGIVALGAGAAVAVCLTAVVGILFFFDGVRDISDVTTDAIAADTGLVFPREATITHFAETPPIDPTWVARITMPKSFRGRFLSTLEARPIEQGSFGGSQSESTPWWKPTRATFQRRFRSGGGAYVNVILSEESGLLVAYIEHDIF